MTKSREPTIYTPPEEYSPQEVMQAVAALFRGGAASITVRLPSGDIWIAPETDSAATLGRIEAAMSTKH